MHRQIFAAVGAVTFLAIVAGPSFADEAADGLAAARNGNYSSALNSFTAAAEHGNALIQAELGSMYFDGIGVPVDHAKAIYWNSKAAEAGRPDAAFRMGLAYDDPRNTYGISRNAALAQSWYKKAWNLAQPLLADGDSTAEYAVGNELAFGYGQARDREKGLVYLRKSADAGNLDAMFQVGELTVAQDEQAGRPLLEQAAEHGHSYAMYVLALVYLHNSDQENARKWLERSVAFRNPQASQKLFDVFHIQTDVPGLGKLPEQPAQSSPYSLSNGSLLKDPVYLFTGVLALSVAVALLTQNVQPGNQAQQHEDAMAMMDRQRQDAARAARCAPWLEYHNGVPIAHYPVC